MCRWRAGGDARPVTFSGVPPPCSTPCPTASPRSSRTCAARAGSPRPTSTPPAARSGSRCSRPTSRCPSSAQFVARVKERAKGAEVSEALNPAQQVIKIVNEELVGILGGETRRLQLRQEPADGDHAGRPAGRRQDDAGRQARALAQEQGHTPLLVACDLQRPNAVTQLQIVGERAGVEVFAPEPGNGVGDPVEVARARDRRRARPASTTSSSSTPPAASASTRS